ncbi:hypothetical protein [Mycobacterium sp. GA-2829]|uniref:hypothetical protein n=1 Tax=Mycobacterium sp. GA-2829 TaxID=1772283 RepID=UPI00073FF06D|nr:hypothetical protein [Mycobacterium sp. GA-2829]KUI32609.1 hypothetical protein AU194_24970 [Mycobacterium sp. GA-2829]
MTNGTVTIGSVAALLYVARRYFRDWGTTKGEAEDPLPGDDLVHEPTIQATEAVWIDAPAAEVWPWLVQIGQNRGGLYSYEKVENTLGLRYRNADEIHREWQHLAVGDTVRLAPQGWLGIRQGIELRVAEVVDGQTIVLVAEPPVAPWTLVWSFHVMVRGADRCRLTIRSRLALRHPGEVMLAELLGPARALLTRGMLIGIRRRAESHRHRQAAAGATCHPG